jgi:hypothetical protein
MDALGATRMFQVVDVVLHPAVPFACSQISFHPHAHIPAAASLSHAGPNWL